MFNIQIKNHRVSFVVHGTREDKNACINITIRKIFLASQYIGQISDEFYMYKEGVRCTL